MCTQNRKGWKGVKGIMYKDELIKLRISSSLKNQFKKECLKQGNNMSQVLEAMIREFVKNK